MGKRTLRAASLFCLVILADTTNAVDVLTFHNDNMRTGANTSETILTQSNVNVSQFGKLYSRTVAGTIYAQPLYVSTLAIGNGVHNVVYVATMENNVYAFDADNSATPAYWTVNLGTFVPNTEVYTNGDPNMYPEIGIVSTPVIDKSSNTIYLVAMTKEGTGSYAHRLHALDLSTGAEKFGGPTIITANLFSSFRQGQRPGLLLANSSVYFGFASFGDLSPYWGYMMRYSASTLAQQNVLNVNPGNVNGLGAGIWESGCGAAADSSGNIFFVTGNSNSTAGEDAMTGGVNYAECAMKLSNVGVTVADFFMPSDVQNIDGADADVGGGGHCLLPDMPGSIPHVMVCGGKNGEIYVINRDNMTHYAADNNARLMQSFNIGSNKGTPVFWQAPSGPHVYLQNEGGGSLLSYAVAVNPTLGYVQLTQDASTTFGFQAHQRALSSNGSTAGTGIIWTWSGTGGDLVHQTTPEAATLHAFNAETLAEIYNSGQNAARDTLGGFAKYNTATVANGRVYVPMTGSPTTQSALVVFGELVDNIPPTIVAVNSVNINTQVTLLYSKPVDPVSSTTLANYAINNGVTISNASLGADQMTLTLTTSPLSTGITYTLTVNNVKDQAPAPNTIAANTQATFMYSVVPPTVSISAPAANASFVAPAVFQVSATASAGANVTIAKVDFFLNGSPAGTATAAPYAVTLTGIAAGSYTLTAKATDSSNYNSTSAGVPITVTAQTGAAYGLGTRPAIGAYLNGALPPLITGTIPATISQLGAFSNPSTLTPASGLIPYAVNVPLWSDNALKTRWMCVPNNGAPFTTGQQISFSPTGEWSFPNGCVFVKEFDLGLSDVDPSITRRLETRFIVRSSDGNVYGVTYKWRSDNSDADLVSSAGLDENITIATATGTRTQTWHYPSQAECLTCHTIAAGGVLGVKTRQLNGNFTYPSTGVPDNQLRTLNHIGMFNPVLQESAIPTYSQLVTSTNPTATLQNMFKSYIDANCANCHRPGGVNVQMDARYDTPIYNEFIIDGAVKNNLGIAGAKVIVPQNLATSMLYQRVNRLDTYKMPPLAHNLIDTTNVQMIANYIDGLPLSAGADTLSIQFEDTNTNGGNSGFNIVTGTAGVQARNNWNTFAGPNGTNQAVIDNNGNPSSAMVSWTSPNTWSNGGPNAGGNDSLLKGYLDTDNVDPISVTVSDIPFSIYNVYVYALGDGGERIGQYWAKPTVSLGGADSGGKVIHYNGVSTTTLVDATHTGIGNYVVFTGLTNSTCVITGQAYQYPGATGNGIRGNINGIQIVDATQTTPTLNAIMANSGPSSGGQVVTVTGANLLPGGTFTLGGVPVASAQYLSDSAYAITTPAGSGMATLVYAGFNGTATLSNSYTYNSAPGTIGDTLSYNFNHNDQNGGVNPLGTAELAGVVSRNYWNNSTANVNLAADANLTDNLGNNTGVTVGWSCNEHWTNSEVPDNGGNTRMMRGYIDETDTLPMFISATGLPAGFQQFDVYVYTTGQHGNATRHGNLRLGQKTVGANLGTSVSYPYAGAGANGFLQVPDNNADTTQVGNYVVFPSITPLNGAIRIDIESADSDYRLGIAGIQLVALAPVITAAAPNGDGLAGGSTITLTGANFRPNAQAITFGGAAATNLTYIDNAHYSVTTPAHSTGVVDVVMTDINGRTGTLAGQFTYSTNPPPDVTSVAPALGPTTGGTAITIGGSNFRSGASVQIGGQNGISVVTIPAANVTVVNSTTITCTTPAAVPANAIGLTSVQVTNADSTFFVLVGAFTYTRALPILASVSPATGPSSGTLAANAVTLTASNHTFTATGVTVTIGGATVAATTLDDQHVTFVPPAHSAGAVNVTVTNGDGGAGNTLTAAYTYVAPAISASAPNQGPTPGGNVVTLTGTNFGPSTVVFFGSNAGTNVTVLSATSLTCAVPASTGGAMGAVNVAVSDNQSPIGTATLTNGYTYAARQPEFTTTAGKIPGVCAKFFYNGSADGTIAATGPATFDAMLPFQGKMVAANAMAGPNSSASPGTILNLIPANSTNFYAKVTGYIKIATAGVYTIYTASDDGSIFYFGNTPATTSLIVSNDFSQGVTERSGQLALAAGLHQFTILYGQGGGGYGLSASYSGPDTGNVETIIPDGVLFSDSTPTVSSINPTSGSTGGNTPVTITGSGFVAGANVTINGVQALNVSVVSATSITCVTPGGPAGSVNVVVINPNGNANSIPFTYDPTIFRNPDNPSNTVAGTSFRYYNLAGPTLPTFTGQMPARVGAKPDASVLPENTITYPIMQNDNHSQQITGYITIPYSGTWTFYTASDDGSVLYIGSSLVVNNNNAQGITTNSGTIGLNAGTHKFTLQYAQGGGGFGCYLGWGCANAPATIPLDSQGSSHGGAPSAANLIPDSAFTYTPPTWQGTGTANWSSAANWNTDDTGLGAFSPVQSDAAFDAHESLVLRFPAVGTTPYNAVNDAPGTMPIAVLELNSAIAGNTISGAQLQFGSGTALAAYPYQNGATQILLSTATILQLGSGAATISAPISVQSDLTLRGNGAGVATLSGALTNANGAALIKNDASAFVIAGDGSGFTQSPLTISAGMLGVNSTLNVATASVASGATLRGNGMIGGAATVAGMLFPGDVSSTLTNAAKGTLTVGSVDFSVNGGTFRARVWLKDAAHVEADKLVIGSTAATAFKLDGTSKLDLRVQVPQGVTSVSNLDVEIVQGGDAANNTYSAGFGSVALSYGAGVTNMSVLYVTKDFVPGTGDTIHVAATQLPGQQPSPALSANSFNRVFIRFNNAVTPIKVDAFTAAAEGAGVQVKWNLVSEYRNAGFNIWRRSVFPKVGEWTQINATLIPGLLTRAGERVCRFYDWPGEGTFEYRLESLDMSGVREFYPHTARADCDPLKGASVSMASGDVESALASAAAERSHTRGEELQSALADAQRRDPNRAVPRAKISRIDRNTDEALLKSLGLATMSSRAVSTTGANATAPEQVLPNWAAAIRAVSASSQRAFTGAKIVVEGSGVLRIPQSALPPGYDARSVRIQREGVAVPALESDAGGLLLYAPGYSDDYTDKDAFFLIKSGSASISAPPAATGLFGASALTTVPGFASVEYHDVYFDWGLRPYTYPPWFSAQYLTEGSTQNFTLDAPASTGGAAVLTVNVWSLTGGDTISPDHNVQAFVNGTFVGSAEWDGGGMALALTFNVPPNTLIAGANTIELVTPAIPGVASQIVLVRSISAQYTKTLDATQSGATASMEFSVTGNASGVYEVLELASPKVWIVDARDPLHAKLVAYQTQIQPDGTYKARFVAQAGGAGNFVIVPAGSEMSPVSVSLRKVAPLKSRTKYLAVGPQQFAAPLKPLVTLHTRDGLRALFVDQEEIFDYYGFGRYGPDPIRAAVSAVKPQYLLLAGRSTYDYHNYSGANVDPLCPTVLVSTSFWAQATSDALFADLGAGYPEIAVGRLPANTVGEMSEAVRHTLDYSGAPTSGWRGHLTADEADPAAGNFPVESDAFAQTNSEIAWTKSYLNTPPGNDQPAVTAAFQQAASGGADVLVYIGHGNAAHLGNAAPHILDTDSVQQWTGNVVFLQSTCTANWFANDVVDYHSVAIQALTQSQGGIAASLATTTYCSSPPAVDFMEKLLLQASTQKHWGDALLKTQQYSWQQSQTAGGETAAWYGDLARTECLLGDPALSISRGK